MSDRLAKILEVKRREVAARAAQRPLEDLRRLAEAMPKPRPFASALYAGRQNNSGPQSGSVHIIAEIKRASPSKGMLRPDLNPAVYAQAYARGGAAALSVLTDSPFFRGSLDDLKAARSAVSLPVLRKDFTVSVYQIYEARVSEADAVLLIVRAVPEGFLRDALALCDALGLSALTEVHDEAELETALRCGARLVGVNNRNLKTFETSLDTSLRLRPMIPVDCIMVAESGIRDRSDIERLVAAGIRNFLVGESLVRASNPETAVRRLIEPMVAAGDVRATNVSPPRAKSGASHHGH
ncbi:indole-3-glycerol phosphate synthase TrpC [Desulfosoma caldarium]|uniref:Indole-3-glycerol phosphate synthase n=1 Tax=Desulfosoma caldarium TaxID=610254 RepID=A0A3N1V263_9BACT|nr:indole-3-glycerol phosphate synthase TrpC [Desulfosoma caldarium]ROQ93596.1 indole-3-glycerol phosphate synthase [Desulfosoma caldarium]